MESCVIKLDKNSLGFYYSGQIVNGVVEITLKKNLSCKGKFNGINNEMITFFVLTSESYFESSSFDSTWKSRF